MMAMSDAAQRSVPFELAALLGAQTPRERDTAWGRLVASHTGLLLSVARSFGGDRDQVMERYAFILEKCREAEYRRLRAIDHNGGAAFSTWLVVIAQRLCHDHHRTVYGRRRETSGNEQARNVRALRRALVESSGQQLDTERLPTASDDAPDAAAIRAERAEILNAAVGALTPRERLLLALRFEDDLSAARIAQVLELPTPFHVYRQLNSVLMRLRAALAARGICDDRD
jgi:RNA polymerase sigma factor (sigma-70 family)